MADYFDAPELREMAKKLVKCQELVSHIDVNEVLFLKEMETTPKAAAKCFSLATHPMRYFTNARFCIVFYESNIDYFSKDQRAILLFHEMMHIPAVGDKLVDHDVKDFYDVLKLGIDWNSRGVKVPNILGEGNGDKKGKKKEAAG